MIATVELGSSDAPSVMGCGFKTPWQLWAELVGLIEPKDEPSEIMEAGDALEPVVLDLFSAKHRLVIYKTRQTARHRERLWQRATPDGLLLEYGNAADRSGLILAEVKCTVQQPGSVPRVEWLIQALHQRIVWESMGEPIRRQYVVQFGGLRSVSWEVPRHQRAMDRILREEENFLELVEKQIPPPVRAEDASVLHHAWPWSRPETALLMDLQAASVAYAQGSEMAKLGESMRAQAQAEIEAALQEREAGIFPDGSRATWRTGKDGRRRFRMSYKEENE